MLLYRLILILFSTLLYVCAITAQQIRINEVVASNSKLFDEDGDTPDWIELYNTSDDLIKLNQWTITDNKSKPDKWQFPDIALGGDNYLFLWASGKDRSISGSIRNHITRGDRFKYLIPNTNPNSNWNNVDYNDGGWPEGPSGFGYGDGDDATQIPTGTKSVYLRKKFTIQDVSTVAKIILHMDYDDAFVAYINGEEVSRANISGNPPAYNRLAITDHESKIYRGEKPDLFILDDVASYLKSGENVLAIQAHNISGASSDFTIIPFLSVQYNVITDEANPTPELLDLSELFLHTSFKISASEETIYLFEGSTLIDSILVKNVPPDHSTGITAQNNQVIFENTTPGKSNDSESYEGLVNETILFSKQAGNTSPFSLELSGVDPPYTIKYTTDASTPTVNSTDYTEKIPITNTTVVRARIFLANHIPSPTQTMVYHINTSHALPVIDIVTDRSNLFDTNTGIYVSGLTAENDFPFFGSNFWEDWERPIHFRYEHGDQSVAFDAGVKIFGGWSRGHPQKSMSIFARGRYGTSEFDFPFFDSRAYDKFQALVLRNSGNDWNRTMYRDAMLTSLMEGSGLDLQAYQPSVVYINGDYWGILNLREKINEHFVASKHGVNPEDIDILEKNGELIFGSNEEYLQLIQFVSEKSLINDSNYRMVEEQIDIDNMIIYQLSQIYFNNTDWPGNNIKFFKYKGGKWRWVLFDTDFGVNIWNNNAVENNTLRFALDASGPDWPNPPWSTLLFRKLIQNQEYRHKFINRLADEMNTRFLSSNFNRHIDTLANNIRPEIEAHFRRWNSDPSSWRSHINRMKAFASRRASIMKGQVLREFTLPNYHNLSIANPNPSFGVVRLNSLVIEDSFWQGDYFESVPIKLIAIPRDGYKFSHWEGKSNSIEQEIFLNLDQGSTITPIFVVDDTALLDLVINEINYKSADDHDTGDWIEIYNPSSSTKEISNWIIKDSEDDNIFTIPQNTLIAGQGYVVLARNIENFAVFHPEVTNVIGGLSLGLSSGGDQVRLYNSLGELKDSVNYIASSPWPENAAGNGYTLELLEPGLDNTLPENWGNVHEHGSPGKTNLKSTSVENIIDVNTFSISPNPSNSILNLTFNLKQASLLEILIYDVNGKLIKKMARELYSIGKQNILTDVSSLETGIYFIGIKGDKNTTFATKRFYKYN